MKRIVFGVLVGTVLALSGCASLNEGLKNVNEGLGKVTGTGDSSGSTPSVDSPYESTFTYTGGGTRTATFTIPARVCAKDEFINLYEVSYVNAWNEQIRSSGFKYAGSSKKADKEASASLASKSLMSVKRLAAPSQEEVQRRGRSSADCVEAEDLGGGKGEAQARTDFEAAGIR